MQRLCDVYDVLMNTNATEGNDPLLPMGLTQRAIVFNVILSPSGEFVTAERLGKKDQMFTVPSTPQAESRSSNTMPFPLVDGLKYLMDRAHGGKLDSYLKQLEAWCAAPHAPECLKILLRYLQKQTLYDDLVGVVGLKLRYNPQTGDGDDKKQAVGFSVAYPFEENRLWMREDVQESWRQQLPSVLCKETALCYVTGKRMLLMKRHPPLQGTSRLISSKDDDFPMLYKGRFVADSSAATISIEASTKLHRALRWLLAHQSFQGYGMSFVGWNTLAPKREEATKQVDEEDEDEEKPAPDTLESYVMALLESVKGKTARWEHVNEPENRSEATLRRQENIVLLGLQTATKGRVSVTYEQEIPGNVFVAHVERWNDGCRWKMLPQKQLPLERTATWNDICEAVMGTKSVQIANHDFKLEKAATKYMRDLQMRLLHCVVEAQPIPENLVSAAFNRAVQPLTFTDSNGKWNEWQWKKCVATACAMIRKLYLDQSPAQTLTPTLDVRCTQRDYLYGRLFALAHAVESNATNDAKTNAVRMMTHFVHQPKTAWLELYRNLLPFLGTLGDDGRSARYYKHLLAQAEQLFAAADVENNRPLSYLFLVGFSAQTRELWLSKEEIHQEQAPLSGYLPPKTRDELYGCLLAIADECEWQAEAEEYISDRDGRTNAMRMTATFCVRPMTTWAKVHDRLIPYLEKLGVKTANTMQAHLQKIEQGFRPEERLSDAPLGRGFLHGYLMMLEAMQHGGLDWNGWRPVRIQAAARPAIREAAYGALLALENQAERQVLDWTKPEEENRPSNAMRFLQRSAQRPDAVWAYLQERMKPYAGKQKFHKQIMERAETLQAWIAENHWDNDQPLGAAYLYYFYLANQMNSRKDD